VRVIAGVGGCSTGDDVLSGVLVDGMNTRFTVTVGLRVRGTMVRVEVLVSAGGGWVDSSAHATHTAHSKHSNKERWEIGTALRLPCFTRNIWSSGS
jgi:hypothetical protein